MSDQAFLARGHSSHQLSPSDLLTVRNCSELTEHGCYLCPLLDGNVTPFSIHPPPEQARSIPSLTQP